MNVAYITSENYDAVCTFLKHENQDLDEWQSVLQTSLFKICVQNTDGIECIFLFDDCPTDLQSKYDFITKSNWNKWLKAHFELPSETYHMLWLTKWHVAQSQASLDMDVLKLVLSSLFISNFEIECILLATHTANDAEQESEKQNALHAALHTLFNPLHRIHRNNNKNAENKDTDESLQKVLDLLYCPAVKLLPNISVRNATVEDFDDLLPLFQKDASLLQRKHGEFFLAELIENSRKDKRLSTLVALSNKKPVGFACFTTNVDLHSLRNAFYLHQFDDFEQADSEAPDGNIHAAEAAAMEHATTSMYNKDSILSKCQIDASFVKEIAAQIIQCYTQNEWHDEQEALLKQAPEHDEEYVKFVRLAFELLTNQQVYQLEAFLNLKLAERPISGHPAKATLTIDTSEPMMSDNPKVDDANQTVVLINLLCVDSNYVYATKVFAQTIFSYYPQCQYLLASMEHDQPVPRYLDYFSRVYSRPCTEYPYDLYFAEKNALNATITVRQIDWKSDADQLEQMIDSAVPNRQKYVTKPNNDESAKDTLLRFVVVVDYKLMAAVYIKPSTKREISEFTTLYNVDAVIPKIERLNVGNTAVLEFVALNPIFRVNVKGILKEIMRQSQIDTLFYQYIPSYGNATETAFPEADSCIIDNFVQVTPRRFIFRKSANPCNSETYGLYTFCREFYAEAQESINHRIVIIGNNDDCAYGCIQYLISQRDLKFNNLTLINSPINISNQVTNGDDDEVEHDHQDLDAKFYHNLNEMKQNTLLFRSNIVSDDQNGNYLQKLCLDNKVEIVQDAILHLDTMKKSLQLKESGICSYDVLVFANGLGPVHVIPQIKYFPKPHKLELVTKRPSVKKLFAEMVHYHNVLLVSPELEKHIQDLRAYFEQNRNLVDNDEDIVLYGDTINMFCLINHLIAEFNIKPTRIVMIKAVSSTSSEFYFRQAKLKEIMSQQLMEMGVKTLQNVVPVGYVTNKQNPNMVDSIQWIQNEHQEINAMIITDSEHDDVPDTNSEHTVRLKLHHNSQSGLPYFTLASPLCILCQNEISLDVLNITNQSQFVVDGQIVVNDRFQTEDAAIYAIGSISKLSRKYQRKHHKLPMMQYANSFDIGIQSAKMIVDHILNSAAETDHKSDDISLQTETCVVAKLLQNHQYFYAYNPQFVMNESTAKEVKSFESVSDKQVSYVAFDAMGYLREILYYGTEWKEAWIKCANLINLHSSLFGDAISNSFKEAGQFVNICEFLCKPQYEIMCDDRFKQWVHSICASGSKSDKSQIKNSIEALVKQIANGNEE
eukprot:CAMPEP_0197023774 /NCGR_PEP_ID=MMETSP1384-20130603/4419_1 /TAXON_ID=29189 /ORGANISM="Ammonia sp." /LENGTH=1284 /DNA_ID=CAMNT_0042452037 /DNA_START=57 /DNA_END=3911 /DNA_ORIENTATION=+